MSNKLGETDAKRCLLWHSWSAWTEHIKGSGSIVLVRRCRQCRDVQLKTQVIPHVHDWQKWGEVSRGTSTGPFGGASTVFSQTRFCRSCEKMDMRMIDPRDLK